MPLVEAYDTRTGDKLPHRVTEAAVNHPVIGKHLSPTPRQKAADTKATKATKTPATGEGKEESDAAAL